MKAGCSLRIGIDSVDKTAVHLAAKLNRAKCLEFMVDGASDEVIEQLKKILVLKNKFKLVPVMLTEDTACIEVSEALHRRESWTNIRRRSSVYR